jgi:DNA ligase-associated metallophosphoesterase
MSTPFTFAGEQFELDSSGALYWPNQNCLVLSDVHLGKIQHFRKNGAAIPLQAQEENYLRLEGVINRYAPKTLLIIGDLFHSEWNREWTLFEAFIKKQPLNIILVAGNHDVIDHKHFEALGIEVVSAKKLKNIQFSHYPEHDTSHFQISGHLHPAVRVQLGAKEKRTLKCFYRKNNQFVLPSFGYFTGNARVSKRDLDEIYVIAEDEVIRI